MIDRKKSNTRVKRVEKNRIDKIRSNVVVVYPSPIDNTLPVSSISTLLVTPRIRCSSILLTSLVAKS